MNPEGGKMGLEDLRVTDPQRVEMAKINRTRPLKRTFRDNQERQDTLRKVRLESATRCGGFGLDEKTKSKAREMYSMIPQENPECYTRSF